MTNSLVRKKVLTTLAIIGDYSSDTQTTPTRDVANLVKGWNVDAVVTEADEHEVNVLEEALDRVALDVLGQGIPFVFVH